MYVHYLDGVELGATNGPTDQSQIPGGFMEISGKVIIAGGGGSNCLEKRQVLEPLCPKTNPTHTLRCD